MYKDGYFCNKYIYLYDTDFWQVYINTYGNPDLQMEIAWLLFPAVKLKFPIQSHRKIQLTTVALVEGTNFCSSSSVSMDVRILLGISVFFSPLLESHPKRARYGDLPIIL